MKRFVVGSSASKGLNVTHISEPAFLIVGIKTDHDSSDTVCASSTQHTSTPSVDLMLWELWKRPLKMNRDPVALCRISASRKSKRPSMPRRSAVSRKTW